jgi:hypothetical protein
MGKNSTATPAPPTEPTAEQPSGPAGGPPAPASPTAAAVAEQTIAFKDLGMYGTITKPIELIFCNVGTAVSTGRLYCTVLDKEDPPERGYVTGSKEQYDALKAQGVQPGAKVHINNARYFTSKTDMNIMINIDSKSKQQDRFFKGAREQEPLIDVVSRAFGVDDWTRLSELSSGSLPSEQLIPAFVGVLADVQRIK